VNAIKESADTIERRRRFLDHCRAVEEQARRRRRFPQRAAAAHGTQQVSAHITDVPARRLETARLLAVLGAQSLSGDSNRLKLEVGQVPDSVRAA